MISLTVANGDFARWWADFHNPRQAVAEASRLARDGDYQRVTLTMSDADLGQLASTQEWMEEARSHAGDDHQPDPQSPHTP